VNVEIIQAVELHKKDNIGFGRDCSGKIHEMQKSVKDH